jgi:hypothetical protein
MSTPGAAHMPDQTSMDWLLSADNPAVRYLTARDLVRPRPSARQLESLRRRILAWEPLRRILALQKDDGSFPAKNEPCAETTYVALRLMSRCGLEVVDAPVARALDYLSERYLGHGAFSYNTGGSGILPCYVGLFTRDFIPMMGWEAPAIDASLKWIVDYQRFDHKQTRAGGGERWPFKIVESYGGCWYSVSCYHGVVATLGALAAVPPASRSAKEKQRLKAALRYLEIHRAFKKSAEDKPLFRHLTQFFLFGGYRSHLIDVLEAIANADPELGKKSWVRDAITAVDDLTVDGRVILAKNYPTKLIDPIPFESVGEPSRFLTYQWLRVKQKLGRP